jgi:hypothetical protein
MSRDQRDKLLQNLFGLEGGLVDHVASPNFRKILARWNVIGTADQGGEEAVQRLKVHRALVSKALEYVSELIDNAIVKAIARTFRWRDMLEKGTHATDVAADGHRCDAGAVGPEHFRPSCLRIEMALTMTAGPSAVISGSSLYQSQNRLINCAAR